MANTAIENLTNLTQPDTGGADVLAIVDLTTPETKKITSRNLLKATITRDIWIGAERFISTTTNGAAINELELATNDVMIKTADFDQTTSESVQFWHTFEEGWNAGTIQFKQVWTAAAGTPAETTDFDLAGMSYANDDAIDQAMGTAQNVTDTLLATNDIHYTGFSGAITLGGTPADGQPNVFKLSRDVATDNLAGDCKTLGIILRYTVTDLASS
jgi:hypothetical protein